MSVVVLICYFTSESTLEIMCMCVRLDDGCVVVCVRVCACAGVRVCAGVRMHCV